MINKYSFKICIVLAFILSIFSINSFAITHQIRMEAASTKDVDTQFVYVYVENEQGQTDVNMSGKYFVKIEADEVGGKWADSYGSFPKVLKFDEGESDFLVQDSEGERLDLNIKIENVRFPGYISLSFKGEDEILPEITSININKESVITLGFSEELQEKDAVKTENFLAITNCREITPAKVEYHKTYLKLFFPDSFDTNEKGYIQVRRIKDLNGNEIIYNSHSPEFEGDCDCSG